MERLAAWALRLIVLLNVLAMAVAFGESYAGLFQWATHHTITGFWAGVWPLMIDTIILIGDAALLVSHHWKWRTRHKAWAWVVTFTALGVSVAANTGHVNSTDWLSRLTAALPPVALAFCMTVGFGVMKRYYANKPAPAATPAVALPLTAWHPVADPLTEMRQVPHTQPESPLTEMPASKVPESLDPTETFAGGDFKVTEKSFTMPRDPRQGLDLRRMRVRDMYDVEPDISVKRVAESLGVAWATADKYLKETKEARGL